MHPVLFEWGSFRLYSYGLMMAVGFLLALQWASARSKAAGVDAEKTQTLSYIALFSGLVGARTLYVILHWSSFQDRWWEIIRIDHGGLVFYGGLLGGVVASLVAIRVLQLPLGKTADVFAPALALGHALGRVGCFLNGCCYGEPTTSPLGMIFQNDWVQRHPTQLYETMALLGIVGILIWRQAKMKRPGHLMCLYVLLYAGWRFGIEFLRGDTPAVALGLTPFQWMSLPLLLGAIVLWRFGKVESK